MFSRSIVSIEVTLVMDKFEAKWLKDLVQNSACEIELQSEKTMRHRLWTVLNEELPEED